VDKGVRVAQGHVGKWTRVFASRRGMSENGQGFAWGWGVSESGQGSSRRAGLSKSLKTAPSLIAPIRADRAEGFADALPSRLARTCEDEDEGAATFTGSTKAMCRIVRRSNTQTGLRRRASDGLRVGLPLRFVTGDDVGWRSPKRIAASRVALEWGHPAARGARRLGCPAAQRSEHAGRVVTGVGGAADGTMRVGEGTKVWVWGFLGEQ